MSNMQLRELIIHASKTVPYYRELFKNLKIDPESIDSVDKLDQIPILTKEMVQKDPESFLNEECLYFPKNRDLLIKRTSGSTGKFLKIYWSRQDEVRSIFSQTKVRHKVFGITPSDRFIGFHTTQYINNKFCEAPEIMYFNNGLNLSFSKLQTNKEKISKYYDEILRFNPSWMFIQPSLAYLLADHVINNNLDVPEGLKYIELSGEYLFDNCRSRIEEAFKVKTCNMYGCNEANGIAMECKHGNLHCLDKNVLVEILKDGRRVGLGEEGDIYITSLTNTTMPFIRYAVGDRGVLLDAGTCSCGSKSPVLKLISGRIGDYVQFNGKEKLSCYVFLYPIEKINSTMGNPINQFKVIQEDNNQFTVNLVLKKSFTSWRDSIAKEFIAHAEKSGLVGIKWNFNFVDTILPDEDTGKLRFFASRL